MTSKYFSIFNNKLSGAYNRRLYFICFPVRIIVSCYYHEQLTKIRTFVKYSIRAYHRYILQFCFGNLNFRDYHGDPSILCFPGFQTISYRFSCCFRVFLPVFLRFPSVFVLFPRGVCPVSSFKL